MEQLLHAQPLLLLQHVQRLPPHTQRLPPRALLLQIILLRILAAVRHVQAIQAVTVVIQEELHEQPIPQEVVIPEVARVVASLVQEVLLEAAVATREVIQFLLLHVVAELHLRDDKVKRLIGT